MWLDILIEVTPQSTLIPHLMLYARIDFSPSIASKICNDINKKVIISGAIPHKNAITETVAIKFIFLL